MAFAPWVTGLLACWCWAVCGCRSVCDINSLKTSTQHTINASEGWASTAFSQGRNKLCGKKKGTRPWNCFFICCCPKGKHVAVSKEWAWSLKPDGTIRTQPQFPTECPLNCLQLKEIRAGDSSMKLFSKWTKTPQNWASNHGDVVQLAKRWLSAQDCDAERPYDTNSGRKSLAAWLDETNTPYPQGFEVHGDLYDVWSENYQTNLPFSDFSRRVQSVDPRTATKALRRLAY